MDVFLFPENAARIGPELEHEALTNDERGLWLVLLPTAAATASALSLVAVRIEGVGPGTPEAVLRSSTSPPWTTASPAAAAVVVVVVVVVVATPLPLLSPLAVLVAVPCS